MSQTESKVVLRGDLWFCLSWSLDSARWNRLLQSNSMEIKLFITALLRKAACSKASSDEGKDQMTWENLGALSSPVTVPYCSSSRSDLRKWIWHVGQTDRRWAESLDQAHVMSGLPAGVRCPPAAQGLQYEWHCSHEMGQSDFRSRCAVFESSAAQTALLSSDSAAHGRPWVWVHCTLWNNSLISVSEEESRCRCCCCTDTWFYWYHDTRISIFLIKMQLDILLLQLQQSNELESCISWAFIESSSLKSTRLSKLESAQITSRPKSCVMPKVWLVEGEGGGVGEGGGGGGGMRKPSHQSNSLPFANLISQYCTLIGWSGQIEASHWRSWNHPRQLFARLKLSWLCHHYILSA